jgi:hypothetical protein
MAQGSGWTDLKHCGVANRPLNGELEELCPSAHSLILHKVSELNSSTDYKYAAVAAKCDDGAVVVDIRKWPRPHPHPPPPPTEKYTRATLDESPLPFILGPSKARQALDWVKAIQTAAAEVPVDTDKGRVDTRKGPVDTDKGPVDREKGPVDIEDGLGGEGFEAVVVESED